MPLEVIATNDGVAVCPWVSALEPALQLERRVDSRDVALAKSGKLKQVKRRSVKREDMWIRNGDVGIAPPALLPIILQELANLGERPAVHDLREKCPEPDWARLNKELRPGQRPMLEAMCSERHVLVSAATGLGKTETILQFRRINPSLRIAVVTFAGNVRNSIAQRLRTGDPEHTVCVLRAGLPFYTADTYVLAVKSLHRLEPDLIDVLIIDEVHGAGSEDAFKQLLRFTSCRVYGFSATPFGRHDKADFAPVVLCGPVRVDLDYDFSVEAGANVPIHAYIYLAEGPANLEKLPDYLQERLGIWRNSRRNALIACVSKQLPAGEQTMVVCRTTEHVLRLHRMMPEFACVFNKPSAEREAELLSMGILPANWQDSPAYLTDVDSARKDMEAGALQKVICTPLWREGVDFTQLRWVVRADGTANRIFCVQVGGRLARKTEGKEFAAVIDFMDRFSGMEWKSQARIGHYRQEGWHVHTVQ